MQAMTGTIKSYSQKTGEGLISLDNGPDLVQVDLKSSAGICLKLGLRVQFAMIHRPKGVFAYCIKII